MKLKGPSRRTGAVPVPQKRVNLKTIDKLSKKTKKGFQFFTLEGKENRLLAKRPNLPPEDILIDKMAVGLNLSAGSEAKPIPKPVLSCKEQNYFKRSFSMRAKSSEMDIKTATIRRTFGKSLTSKENQFTFDVDSNSDRITDSMEYCYLLFWR